MKYNHTQIWYLPIIAFILLVWYFIAIAIYSWEYIILPIWALVLLVLWLLFYGLSVSITENKIRLKFWIGLIRKSFLLSEIKSVKIVKNKWYYGWGIRYWFWPKMWIFNISWYDAVKIIMYNDKIYRIWTDDPENLKNEILNSIK
jgi:hypothetical protein